MPAMHLIKLLFSQVGSTKSRDKSTLEAFSLASGILFSLQREKREMKEKRGQSEYANNISTRFLPRLVHHFAPQDVVVILIWKFVDALRCFFFRNTTLKLRQIFICTWQKERERGGEEYRYVRNIDGLPPCVPYPSRARHFLRLKSLHVQFSTDIQRYFVYVYVFFLLLLLAFLFIRSLLFAVYASCKRNKFPA